MEGFTLNTFLIWLISGGATVVARLVIARIPVLQRELSESERVRSWVLYRPDTSPLLQRIWSGSRRCSCLWRPRLASPR
jgi:hypothetical protein